MKKKYTDLLHVFTDFFVMANSPKRDADLLEKAGVTLDRALYPLLIGIEKFGPIGVVDLSEVVGRDYTTVSRQIAKLEELKFIKRQPSKNDSRKNEAQLTTKGLTVTRKLSELREELIDEALKDWNKKDLSEVTRLMRRLIDDLKSV